MMGPYAFFPTALVIPLPEHLPDGTLYFQDFHTDATFTQLLSTQRLEVPIVK
ncbi:MAG: hypothetical protein H6835_06950 [Planctomycetes bacterium]|nr:hypothetical protein [Planctomycetota bacterium]